MCLEIRNNFVKPATTQTVYKVYINKIYCGKRLKTKFDSVFKYRTAVLRTNRQVISDRQNCQLTKDEIWNSEVYRGLHCMTTLDSARALKESFGWNRSSRSSSIIIAEFQGKPEDFVVGGKFDDCPSVVYRKLKFIKIVE